MTLIIGENGLRSYLGQRAVIGENEADIRRLAMRNKGSARLGILRFDSEFYLQLCQRFYMCSCGMNGGLYRPKWKILRERQRLNMGDLIGILREKRGLRIYEVILH